MSSSFIIFIIILLILFYFFYHHYYNYTELKCIVSTIDGNKYCVRDRENIQEASNLLASTVQKCNQLVK